MRAVWSAAAAPSITSQVGNHVFDEQAVCIPDHHASFPWINNLVGFYGAGELVGIDGFADVKRGLNAFLERPAVQRGLKIPARG